MIIWKLHKQEANGSQKNYLKMLNVIVGILLNTIIAADGATVQDTQKKANSDVHFFTQTIDI